MSNNIAIILRSLPGAGKSTLATNLLWEYKKSGKKNVVVYSTDDYFTMEDGSYVFDGRKLHAAHEWNFARFKRAVDLQYEVVMADNTNVQFWECLNYVEYALKNFYIVEFREPETPWKFDIDELLKRNKHNVPRAAFEKMVKTWDTTEEILYCLEEKYDGKVVIDIKENRVLRTSKEW